MHGGLKTRTRVNIHYFESTDIERDGAGGARAAWTRSWCRAASASAASRARSRRCATRASRHSVPGHLPRHAAGDHRVRAPRARPQGREQHRVQPRHDPSGDRADHRMAGPARAAQQARDEKSDLGGTMRLGAQEVLLSAGLAGARALRQRSDRRAPPPPLRVQQQLPGRTDRGRVRSPASRATAWSRSSSCRAIPGSSPPSSTRNSPPRRATAIRCSPASCAPRARIAPRCSRAGPRRDRRGPMMRLCSFEVGPSGRCS